MGLRQTLSEKPWVGIAVGAALLAAAAVVMLTAGMGSTMKLADKAFYTVDDGQTLFTDSRSLVAPFLHEGKVAVKVNKFSCDGGKTSFVAYLSKFSDSDKKAYETAIAAKTTGKGPPPMLPMNYLVKKPGSDKWYSALSPEGRQLIDINCQSGFPQIVHP